MAELGAQHMVEQQYQSMQHFMAALAAQSEALSNAKLLAAQNLIAKQAALEKQIETDRGGGCNQEHGGCGRNWHE